MSTKNLPRRDVLADADSEIIDALTHKPKKGRARPWDRKHQDTHFSAWGIPPELQARIKAISDGLGVPIGEVARRLLEGGLDLYDRGDLPMVAKRKPGAPTLYPDE